MTTLVLPVGSSLAVEKKPKRTGKEGRSRGRLHKTDVQRRKSSSKKREVMSGERTAWVTLSLQVQKKREWNILYCWEEEGEARAEKMSRDERSKEKGQL